MTARSTRRSRLESFARTSYLNEGHPHVLDQARPLFERLIDELSALPEDAPPAASFDAFRRCVVGLNGFEGEIETVERECFCSALYALGAIVGLSADSQFVEQWRGDW